MVSAPISIRHAQAAITILFIIESPLSVIVQYRLQQSKPRTHNLSLSSHLGGVIVSLLVMPGVAGNAKAGGGSFQTSGLRSSRFFLSPPLSPSPPGARRSSAVLDPPRPRRAGMLAPLSSTVERVIDSPNKGVPKLSSLNLHPLTSPPHSSRQASPPPSHSYPISVHLWFLPAQQPAGIFSSPPNSCAFVSIRGSCPLPADGSHHRPPAITLDFPPA